MHLQEIGTLSKIKGEFDARNCKLLGISTDSVERHEGWIKDINETQDTDVTFPLISDEKGSILNDVRLLVHAFWLTYFLREAMAGCRM